MLTVVILVHLMLVIGMIGVVLLQKSEGGGLVSSTSGFMTGRGTANVLTRATAILAACFMLTSVLLVVIPRLGTQAPSIIPDSSTTQQVPAPAPAKPATPPGPTVPSGQ